MLKQFTKITKKRHLLLLSFASNLYIWKKELKSWNCYDDYRKNDVTMEKLIIPQKEKKKSLTFSNNCNSYNKNTVEIK